jgi:hypothetical protein
MTSTLTIEKPANVAECKEAPAVAFRFEGSPFQFAAKDSEDTKSTKSRPVSILARTKQPLYHWYWGWCVHDFAGMRNKSRIVLDYSHDSDELIGYADKFSVDAEGLRVDGRVESIIEDDEAEKLLKRADKGIPFESSIYFDPTQLVIEFIPEGSRGECNGETVDGPMVVFREWLLRAVAVCPHGYDSGSETAFSAADRQPFKLNWKGNPMSTTPANKTTEANANGSDIRAELKQYTDKFGAVDGVEYFTAGKSMAVALDEHVTKLTNNHAAEVTKLKADHDAIVTKLTADVTKLTTERDDAIAKVNAAKLAVGEQTAIDTGTPGSATKLATSMSEARKMAKKTS